MNFRRQDNSFLCRLLHIESNHLLLNFLNFSELSSVESAESIEFVENNF